MCHRPGLGGRSLPLLRGTGRGLGGSVGQWTWPTIHSAKQSNHHAENKHTNQPRKHTANQLANDGSAIATTSRVAAAFSLSLLSSRHIPVGGAARVTCLKLGAPPMVGVQRLAPKPSAPPMVGAQRHAHPSSKGSMSPRRVQGSRPTPFRHCCCCIRALALAEGYVVRQ